MDLTKCQCKSPGFCPVFNRTMGTSPPDWKWCQSTTENERKKYYDLLSRSPPPVKKKLIEILSQFKDDPDRLFLYYLTQNNRHHACEIADRNQMVMNERIIEYINSQSKKEPDFDNIEILCLGHKQIQFDNIPDRDYLTKTNLNNIDAGKYSENKWAESRAFVGKNLFSKDTDFVGFVTASWNLKYEPFSFIENFHNWKYAHVLLKSTPQDRVVVCADIFCPCCWLYKNKDKQGLLSGLFHSGYEVIGKSFLKSIDLIDYNHIKVPFGNQMIMHKDTLRLYLDYLNDYEIFQKIEHFVNNIGKKYTYITSRSTNKLSQYKDIRLQAYLMEMVSCFWFAKQDFIYLPVTERRMDWYSQEKIHERLKW